MAMNLRVLCSGEVELRRVRLFHPCFPDLDLRLRKGLISCLVWFCCLLLAFGFWGCGVSAFVSEDLSPSAFTSHISCEDALCLSEGHWTCSGDFCHVRAFSLFLV